MEQLNRIELRGTVGSVRLQTFNGNQMIRFTLATNYAFKDKEGMAVIDTAWHNIVAWRNSADLAEKYIEIINLFFINSEFSFSNLLFVLLSVYVLFFVFVELLLLFC